MSRTELPRAQLKSAHDAIEETMDDVTPELLDRMPAGKGALGVRGFRY